MDKYAKKNIPRVVLLSIVGGIICSLIGIFSGIYISIIKPSLDGGVGLPISSKAVYAILVTMLLICVVLVWQLRRAKADRSKAVDEWPS